MAIPDLEARWDDADVRDLVERELAVLDPLGAERIGEPAAVAE